MKILRNKNSVITFHGLGDAVKVEERVNGEQISFDIISVHQAMVTISLLKKMGYEESKMFYGMYEVVHA